MDDIFGKTRDMTNIRKGEGFRRYLHLYNLLNWI